VPHLAFACAGGPCDSPDAMQRFILSCAAVLDIARQGHPSKDATTQLPASIVYLSCACRRLHCAHLCVLPQIIVAQWVFKEGVHRVREACSMPLPSMAVDGACLWCVTADPRRGWFLLVRSWFDSADVHPACCVLL
jgi:hypothetical protein